MCTVGNPGEAIAQQPEYQAHIDWAANDSGHPNCPERYLVVPVLATCLTGGNRSCVTSIAIEAAYRHLDQLSLSLMAARSATIPTRVTPSMERDLRLWANIYAPTTARRGDRRWIWLSSLRNQEDSANLRPRSSEPPKTNARLTLTCVSTVILLNELVCGNVRLSKVSRSR